MASATIDHATNASQFARAAAQLLGAKGFTQDPEMVEPWLTDWRGRYTGRALGLASPASTSEVAALVKLCAQHRVPIVAQGGNSGMAGGATPDQSGAAIVLSLRRMNQIRALDVGAGTAVCEAGLILQSLHEAAAERNMRFALTLGGKGSATIGGLISTNAGGTQVLRYGTMRAQVLGLEAVLPDGQVLDRLAVLKKDNRGFDLKQLFIGSEGTLGIVTAASLRLLPQPKSRVTAWVGLGSIVDARTLLEQCERALGDTLEGFEVVPAHCLASVLSHVPDARAPLEEAHAWNALIECTSPSLEDDALRERVLETLTQAMEAGLVQDAVLAANETQASDFWDLRDAISDAERAHGPAVQHDISVPVERMAEFIRDVSPVIEQAFPGTTCAAFGHLGDGNVHFHVLAPPGAVRGVWEEEDGKKVSALVYELVVEAQGSISAEHGIGQMKVDYLQALSDPATRQVMRAVKDALDPDGILNPGKLLPRG